jgi:hypothetical protein
VKTRLFDTLKILAESVVENAAGPARSKINKTETKDKGG